MIVYGIMNLRDVFRKSMVLADQFETTDRAELAREGNGRSTRIWLDYILKKELGQCMDWSLVDQEDDLLAMERSPIRDIEIKHV